MSLLAVEDLVVGYGAADEVLKGVDCSDRNRRDRRHHRPERRRQVDAAQIHCRAAQTGAREHPPPWRIHRRARTARHQPARRGLRAAGTEHLSNDVGARKPRDGRLHRSRRQPAQDRLGVRAVSHPGRAPARGRARTVGRRASDAGHGDGVDGRSQTAAAGRAFRGALPAGRGIPVREHRGGQSRTACRLPWSSRMRARH